MSSEKAEGEYSSNCPEPPSEGDWIIELTEPGRVYGETIYLNGNLTLESGTLILINTTIIMKENVTRHNIVAKNGTILTIGGCTIKGENSNANYGFIAMHSSMVTITNSNFSELGYVPAMNLSYAPPQNGSGMLIKTSNAMIIGNTFYNCKSCVILAGTPSVPLSNVEITNNTFESIFNYSVLLYYANSNKIMGNKIKNCTNIHTSTHPFGRMLVVYSNDNIISDNTFENIKNTACVIARNSNNTLLKSNTFNLTQYSVYFYNNDLGSTTKIIENSFMNCNTGIYFDVITSKKNATIEGNLFYNCTSASILIDTISPSIYLSVSNNTFEIVKYGLRIWSNSNITLFNNNITSCDEFISHMDRSLAIDWIIDGTSYINSTEILIPGNITVKGRLIAENTVISFNSSVFGLYRYLHAENAEVTFKNSILNATNNSFEARFISSIILLENTAFSKCGKVGGFPYEYDGVYITNSQNLQIEKCTFANSSSGLIVNSSTGRIANSTFKDLTSTGLVVFGSQIVIELNTFTNCRTAMGSQTYPISACVIAQNMVSQAEDGICLGSSNILYGNTVQSTTNALYVLNKDNNVSISTFHANTVGAYINSSNNSFDLCTFSGNLGIKCYNAHNIEFINSTILNTGGTSSINIELTNSVVYLYGTTFTNSSVKYGDATSRLFVYWFLLVQVICSEPYVLLPNTLVTITNNSSDLIFSGFTSTGGYSSYIHCLEYEGRDINSDNDDTDANERISGNPYFIQAYFEGFSNSTSVVMDKNCTVRIYVTLPPLTSFISVTPSDPGPDNWYNTSVSVELHSHFPDNSNATIYYSISGDLTVNLTKYNGTIYLNSSGKYYITYYLSLFPFPNETQKGKQIWIDLEPPYTVNSTLQGWYNSDFEILFEVLEYNLSGRYVTYYSIDDPMPINILNGGTLLISDLSVGLHTVYFYSVDVAGNIESIRSCSFSIDTKAPLTTCNYNGEWRSTDFIIYLNASDEGIGVNWTEYRIDNGEWIRGTQVNVTSALLGIHKLEFRSADHLGNVEIASSVTIKFDSLPPTTTLDYDGKNRTNENVEILIIPRDNEHGSGVNTTWYRLDGGIPILIKQTRLILEVQDMLDGNHTVSFYSIDYAGNIENEKIFWFIVDKTAPIISITSPTNGSTLKSGNLRLAGNATDEDEEIFVQARIGEGIWFDCVGGKSWYLDITVPAGDYTFIVRATDTAGNAEQTSFMVTVKIPEKALCPLPLTTLLMIIIIVVLVLVGIALSRRRKKECAEITKDVAEPLPNTQDTPKLSVVSQATQSPSLTSQVISSSSVSSAIPQTNSQPYNPQYLISQQSYMPERFGYSYYETSQSDAIKTQSEPTQTERKEEVMEASPVTGSVYGEELIPTASVVEGAETQLIQSASPSESTDYSIEGVFLIYQDGRPITAYTPVSSGKVDKELLSSMLTALRQYMKIAMNDKSHDLRQISFGKNTVLMEKGIQMYIACVVQGEPPEGLSREMRKVLISIRDKYPWIVKQPWDGDMSKLSGIDELIAVGIIDKFKPAEKEKRAFIAGSELPNIAEETHEEQMLHPAARITPKVTIVESVKPSESISPERRVATIDGQQLEILGEKSKVRITFEEAKARVDKIKERIDNLKMRGIDTQEADKKYNLAKAYLTSKNFAKCYKFAEEAENIIAKLGG